MLTPNQMLMQTFLISTVLNTFADQDPNRNWLEKVGRAALISVPVAITIDTTAAIAAAANKFPTLGLSEASRPRTIPELAEQVEHKVAETARVIVARYTRPEDEWKNP